MSAEISGYRASCSSRESVVLEAGLIMESGQGSAATDEQIAALEAELEARM